MTALAPKRPSESVVEMTQMILPSDANPLNAAFGGRVMEWIDICGAVAAQRHCRQSVVTASMDDLHFHAPVKVGWIVQLKARVLATFHSSMEIGVTVHSENPYTGEKHLTTSALLTFVALDAAGGKLPVPQLIVESPEEKQAQAEAIARRQARLAKKGEPVAWLKLF